MPRRQTRCQQGLCEREKVPLDGEIFLRDLDTPLRPAQIDVVARHFGEEGQRHIGAILGNRLIVGARRLDGTANAAKDIDLPGGIKPSLVEITANARPESAGRHARRDVAAAQVARIFAVGIGDGVAARAGKPLKRPRFTHSRFGLGQVGR